MFFSRGSTLNDKELVIWKRNLRVGEIRSYDSTLLIIFFIYIKLEKIYV